MSVDHDAALTAMYAAYRECVFGFVLRRCNDEHVADEIVAETFTAAWTSLRHASLPRADLPWLLGIANHKLTDHWRRHQRDERKVHAAGTMLLDRRGAVHHDPAAEHAQIVLDRLPATYRTALQLRYVEGLSVAEMAALLHRSVHSTESLLARARTAFRRDFSAEWREDVA